MKRTIKPRLRWLRGITLTLMVLLTGCDVRSTEPAEGASSEPSNADFERCEDYPVFDTVMGYGDVVPPIGWSQAYRADGSQSHFSLEGFFCGEAYADKQTLILVIGAGWCSSCSRLIEMHINPIAAVLTADLGAELVYLEIQDTQYTPADNGFAYRHLRNLIGGGAGWRVGDLDTMLRDGDAMKPRPSFITQQPNLPILPAVWVIRKRDMRIIATRELAWQSRPGELPLELIASDPEQDWRDPPLPPFQNQCDPADDEETDEITNNRLQDATVIEPGAYTGGICDPLPDFYALETEGSWRLSLVHNTRQGDLDLILWDSQMNRAAVDSNGRIIGSLTADSVETLSGDGPAVVQVRGYGGASASYTLTLEAL